MSKPKRHLIDVKPITENQSRVFSAFYEGNHVVCSGSAGTGKTFIALYLAMQTIYSQRTPIDHLIIVRSAVATRDIGFLPGTVEEKIAIYEAPYMDLLDELHNQPGAYETLERDNILSFQPTSFLRGVTWDCACIILDEAQNMTFHEINSVVTRLGEHSRLFVCGDTRQRDLHDSGFEKFLRVCQWMNDIRIIKFTKDDIVRSDFVKRWITACEEADVF